MKLLKHFFNFYINSSIHVALSVISLSWITLLDYNISVDVAMQMFLLFSAISGYNFVKYIDLAKFHHSDLVSWLKTIQLFTLFSFILMCYYALNLNLATLILIVVFGIVTFFYAVPFLPKKRSFENKSNLRDIGGLKVYLIALVWTGVTVFLPLINYHYLLDTSVVFLGIQRFIFIIALMLPFEIRDLRFDNLNLTTIPQKIGVKKTKQIGILMLLMFFFLEFFKDELNLKRLVVLGVITIITGLFIVFSKKNQGKYYSAFWVEAIPILWGLLLYLFS